MGPIFQSGHGVDGLSATVVLILLFGAALLNEGCMHRDAGSKCTGNMIISGGQEAAPTALQQECESLVNSLSAPPPASPQVAQTAGEPARVTKIKQRLASFGAKAFPTLIGHLDDKRYCYSDGPVFSDPWGEFHKRDVAFVCRNLVEFQVDFSWMRYKDRQGADGRRHPNSSYFFEHDMKRWWFDRRGRTLVELRKEVIGWYIQRERGIGFLTARMKLSTSARCWSWRPR